MFDPARPPSRVFLPAILSGLLLYACYFPLNCGALAWFALVPLLSLVRANARPWRIYLAAFVGGLFCYVPAIQWMRVAHPAMYAAWLLLAIYCSFGQAVAIAFVRRLDRAGVPLLIAVPIAWVSVEYFRSHFPSGFSWLEPVGLRNPIGFGWYLLGHTQHAMIPLIQLADLTGVYGLTAVLAVVNAFLYAFSTNIASWRTWLRISEGSIALTPRARVGTVAMVVLPVLYGQFQLSMHKPFEDGPRVALIQGNLPQSVKDAGGEVTWRHFRDLADRAARPEGDHPRPDLVVWPETSYLLGWDRGPGTHPDFASWLDHSEDFDPGQFSRGEKALFDVGREIVRADLARWRVPTLFGLSTYERTAGSEDKWVYNSALLVSEKGVVGPRYDKMHLVPFGEYVLFGETLPFMSMLSPYGEGYSCKPGTRWTRFPVTVRERTYHFACIICYEDSDPTLSRAYVRPGAEGVDFFVNISNDGWFDGTEQHEQHLAITRFRAVETRRSVVRAVNMGVSAIVDPDGRVVEIPGETWSRSKKVEGIVRGAVPIDSRKTTYAQFGDWLPLTCWAFLFGGFIYGWRRKTNGLSPVATVNGTSRA